VACGVHVPFFGDNSLWRECEYIETAVSHEAKVRRGGAGDAGVEEGRVLDGIAVVTRSAEGEHREDGKQDSD